MIDYIYINKLFILLIYLSKLLICDIDCTKKTKFYLLKITVIRISISKQDNIVRINELYCFDQNKLEDINFSKKTRIESQNEIQKYIFNYISSFSLWDEL